MAFDNPFMLAKQLVSGSDINIKVIKKNQYMLMLILAGCNIDLANELNRYMFNCDADIFANMLKCAFEKEGHIKGWIWVKKQSKAPSKAKLNVLIDEYLDELAKKENLNVMKLKQNHVAIIQYKLKNADKDLKIEYIKHMLDYLKKDESEYESFKIPVVKKQQSLF